MALVMREFGGQVADEAGCEANREANREANHQAPGSALVPVSFTLVTL